tara:strand:+ start:21 stop:533 length:513 start_codon:yes stop_codon:yes gene_type:complete
MALTQVIGNGLASSGLPAGTVLQVVSATKTDVQSTTSTSFVDVAGMSATITPRSSSSKILVTVNASVGADNANFANLTILRGSTAICIGDASSDRARTTGMLYEHRNEGNIRPISMQHLDSPNTTSATTYKVQIKCASSGNTHINKSHRDTDAATESRTISNITVMEIGA